MEQIADALPIVPECIICQEIFFAPVTLPCGHSYCRPCIVASLQHRPLCPSCRLPLIGNPNSLATNYTLQTLVETSFPKQYAEKKRSLEQKGIQLTQSTADSTLLNQNAGQQQQPAVKFNNALILTQQKIKYLFPSTIVRVELAFKGKLDALLQQCPDRRAVIRLAPKKSDSQVIASLCEIVGELVISKSSTVSKQVIECDVRVISRVKIDEVKSITINYNEERTNGVASQNNDIAAAAAASEQQQQQQVEQKQQQQFEEGFTFEVCRGEHVLDSQVNANQETGITENAERLVAAVNEIFEDNGGINNTMIQVSRMLQKSNFIAFLSPGYLNSIQRIEEFAWICAGVFNFTLEERERLWDASSLIERIVLLNSFLLKFSGIRNITIVFDIDAPGHSNSQNWIFLFLLIAVVAYKIFI